MLDLPILSQLPPNIRFGTSSWNYPGWQGVIYFENYRDEKELGSRSLAEYARYFKTVGIDSSFYGPPAKSTLERYVSQVPEDFKWVSKVWEDITIPRYANFRQRYGEKAGKVNPDFLNAKKFKAQILERFTDPRIVSHCGVFVFQFQRLHEDLERFISALDSFLGELPRNFRYAVEVRNPELLSESYFSVLNTHGVTHCFNHWSGMPPLSEQMKRAALSGGLTADFFVARILTPLGVSYAEAVKLFEPYSTVKRVNPEMRTDLVRLMRRALERNITAYILVNNRAEGCAPQTIVETAQQFMKSSRL